MKPVLYIMRGVPLSGKDTYCNAHFNQTDVLSSDRYRAELFGDTAEQRFNKQVFDHLRAVLDHRLANRVPVTVVNATNIAFKDSKEYFELAAKWGAKVIVLDIKPVSLVDLIKRNDYRASIRAGVNLPHEVIEKKFNQYNEQTENFKVQTAVRGGLYIEVPNVEHGFSEDFQNTIDEFIQEGMRVDIAEDQLLYVIGDVHGLATELNMLIDKIHDHASLLNKRAFIVQLGDIIDRGPEPFRALHTALTRCDATLLGNHEWLFIQEYNGYKECRSSARRITHDLFKALSPEDQQNVLEAFLNLPSIVCTKTRSDEPMVVFSHSPLSSSIKDNRPMTMRNTLMDSTKFSQELYEQIKGKVDDNTIFVHGHQSWHYIDIHEQIKLQLQNAVKFYNIDSGAVYGNELTALCVDNLYVLQVKSSVAVEKEVFN